MFTGSELPLTYTATTNCWHDPRAELDQYENTQCVMQTELMAWHKAKRRQKK